jgi:hypothetical protein
MDDRMAVSLYLQAAGSGILQTPPLQYAGPSHEGPVVTLQDAPSAAAATHFPVAEELEGNLQSAPEEHVIGLPLTTPQA